MSRPYESYVAVAEALNRLTPATTKSARRCSTRSGSGRERHQDRPRPYRKQAVAAFDQPTTAAPISRWRWTAKNMPTSTASARSPPSLPASDVSTRSALPSRSTAKLAAARADRPAGEAGGCRQSRRARHRAHSGRGRVHRAGARVPAALLEWCRAHDVVFIADEVQTGFGRTGAMFACDHEGSCPT